MEEKRRFPRYFISQMLPINFNNFQDVTNVKGINISKVGLLCDVNLKIPVETNIYLLLTLPGSTETKIEIQAKVVRVTETDKNDIFRTALEFIFIEESSKKLLFAYIDNLRIQ